MKNVLFVFIALCFSSAKLCAQITVVNATEQSDRYIAYLQQNDTAAIAKLEDATVKGVMIIYASCSSGSIELLQIKNDILAKKEVIDQKKVRELVLEDFRPISSVWTQRKEGEKITYFIEGLYGWYGDPRLKE